VPSLIDLRRRVRAVKNTQQITKAMKMVAASKLRRAQERILSARPYAVQMQHVLRGLASRVDEELHPLLITRDRGESSRTLVIAVTADKGLCGSFNTNAIKGAAAYMLESPRPCVLGLVGRKGRDFFGRRGYPVLFEQIGIFQKLSYENAQDIARLAIDAYTSEQVDRVVLVYNEFKSVISQRVVVDQLLPIAREEVAAEVAGAHSDVDYLFEPEPQEIFNKLLPRYIDVQIYRALPSRTPRSSRRR
jgi:F-type H+-transporting ATPase subunit gamma